MLQDSIRNRLEEIFNTVSNEHKRYFPLMLYKGSKFEGDQKWYAGMSDINLREFKAMIAERQPFKGEEVKIIISNELEPARQIYSALNCFENRYFGNSVSMWEVDELQDHMYGAVMVDSDFNIYKTIFRQWSNSAPFFIYKHYYYFSLLMSRKEINNLIQFHNKVFQKARIKLNKMKSSAVAAKLRDNFSQML